MKNTIKVLFVCHGNICRSPMAEFLFKDILTKTHLINRFIVSSSATSTEEIGNDIYTPVKKLLLNKNIPFSKRQAKQITLAEYNYYDYIIVMEQYNINNLKYVIGNIDKDKVFRLLDFTSNPRDISDPWYTGNYDRAYNDIYEGLIAFIEYLKQKFIL